MEQESPLTRLTLSELYSRGSFLEATAFVIGIETRKEAAEHLTKWLRFNTFFENQAKKQGIF
jgi:hypothetical protein